MAHKIYSLIFFFLTTILLLLLLPSKANASCDPPYNTSCGECNISGNCGSVWKYCTYTGKDSDTDASCSYGQNDLCSGDPNSCVKADSCNCGAPDYNSVSCVTGASCTGSYGNGCNYCQSWFKASCQTDGSCASLPCTPGEDGCGTTNPCAGVSCPAPGGGGGGGGGGGSTPTPVNPAGCDSNQLTMTVDPDPAIQSYNITFSNSSSGSQGSAYIGDSWSGGVNCSGAFWGSKTCLANASGNFSWTHYWGLGADGSTHCSKSINYVINAAPTASITGPTTGAVNTALSYTATAHDSGGKLNQIGIYISPTSSQSWLTPYLESAFTQRWDGSYTATWTPTSVGTYYVVTNAYNSLGGKCTGNPFGISYGWSDCGNSDAITVSIASCSAAGTPPACRTSGGSVPDGSCGTTPYTANCATSCSSGICTPSGACSVSNTTMTTLATDTTIYTATNEAGGYGAGTYTYDWRFSDGSRCGVSTCTKSFPTTPGTITASLTISSAGLTSSAISCPGVTVQQAVGPWIRAVGDVHSNTGINAPGGP